MIASLFLSQSDCVKINNYEETMVDRRCLRSTRCISETLRRLILMVPPLHRDMC